ncbi:MAG: hypothetical protein D4S01_06420 [Dehalococcoidia bacterium]|nr:MAG: hypothetical protein D4S01_06420 [Dehalococcoidia bacterium]
MRVNGKPAQVLKPGEVGATIPGGGNFLTEVRRAIADFRELMKAAGEFRQLGEFNTPVDQSIGAEMPFKQLNPAKPKAESSPGIKEFIGYLIAAGYGDTPIGDLLDQVRPLTLNQFLNIARSKGVKGVKPGK